MTPFIHSPGSWSSAIDTCLTLNTIESSSNTLIFTSISKKVRKDYGRSILVITCEKVYLPTLLSENIVRDLDAGFQWGCVIALACEVSCKRMQWTSMPFCRLLQNELHCGSRSGLINERFENNTFSIVLDISFVS